MSLESYFEQPYTPGLNVNQTLALHIANNRVYASVMDYAGNLVGLKQFVLNENTFTTKGISELTATLQRYPVVSNGFSEIKIAVDTPYFTVVPLALFEEDKAHLLLRNQFKIGNDFFINALPFTESDVVLITAMPNELKLSLINLYPAAKIFYCSSLLHEIFQQKLKHDDATLVAYINSTHVFVAVYKHKLLMLINSYEISNQEDFLYFILNIFDKLELSHQHAPVYLCGDISYEDGKYTGLKKYVSKLILLESENNRFANSQLFYLNLLMHQCV